MPRTLGSLLCLSPLCFSFFLIVLAPLNLMLVHIQANFSVHRLFIVLVSYCQKQPKISVSSYHNIYSYFVGLWVIFAKGSACWLDLAISVYSWVRFRYISVIVGPKLSSHSYRGIFTGDKRGQLKTYDA